MNGLDFADYCQEDLAISSCQLTYEFCRLRLRYELNFSRRTEEVFKPIAKIVLDWLQLREATKIAPNLSHFLRSFKVNVTPHDRTPFLLLLMHIVCKLKHHALRVTPV